MIEWLKGNALSFSTAFRKASWELREETFNYFVTSKKWNHIWININGIMMIIKDENKNTIMKNNSQNIVFFKKNRIMLQSFQTFSTFF